MSAALSFDQAPPISVPFRFFLTAPWFGVAAGVLLVCYGESALVTRWSPLTLALTHLLTAGFMLQAMCGALLQFVPVAAGGNVSSPGRVAAIVHPALALGALLLVAAFLAGSPVVFLATLPFVLIGGGVFVMALLSALFRIRERNPSLSALRLAVFGLALTLLLGMLLTYALSGRLALPLLELTRLHVAAGLGAWALVLILGVSLFVVPMFQLTPPYPARLAWRLPRLALLATALSAADLVIPGRRLELISMGLLLFLALVYALITLRLQTQRRRRVTDPAFWFFRGGMLSIVLAVIVAGIQRFAGDEWNEHLVLSLGASLLMAIVSIINGMLYKIVPFISWLHLQRLTQVRGAAMSLLPNQRLLIPERFMRGQLIMHFCALVIVLLAIWLPVLSRLAGVVWIASFGWLALNLTSGVRRYAQFRDRILASAVNRES